MVVIGANVSNTPFREYKHYVHEGGISTPLVVHWPKGIQAKDELRSEPSHLIDLMATCLDVANVTYPKKLGDVTLTPLEGVSLRPVFRGKSLDRKMLFFEHEGNRALRIGDWKLVAKGRHGQNDVKWELFNIANDRSEMHDLSSVEPERYQRMQEMWREKAMAAQVLPMAKIEIGRKTKNASKK